MKTVSLVALILLSHGIVNARLGETREQAMARYGRPTSEGTPASARPLIDGAQELIFDRPRWKIRCALLLATDGKWYVVREEYTKQWDRKIVKDQRDFEIQDFERNEVFQIESNQFLWKERTITDYSNGREHEFGTDFTTLAGVTGKIWQGPGDRLARMPFGNRSLILELPHALRHEAQLQAIKERSRMGPAQSSSRHPLSSSLSADSSRDPSKGPPNSFAVIFVLILLSTGTAAWFSPKTRKVLTRWCNLHPCPPVRVSSGSSEPPAEQEPQVPRKPHSFRDLPWDDFEILVGEIYRLQGFSVAINNATGADGGVDLMLTREDERVLVQCKNWNGTKVTAKEIREFFGVTISECATRGIFVTSSSFTRDAREFAAGKPMELINGEKLMALVDEAQKTSVVDLFDVSQWASLFALSVKLTTPPCPFCRSKMILRNSPRGKFWGCSTFPRCRGKRDARRHLVAGVR